MEQISVDEENKKRLIKYIKSMTSMYGYEKDINILESTSQLTEKLAHTIFEDIMRKCQTTRDILKPNGEIEQEISQIFDKFDRIPKPKDYEQYGYYDGAFSNMELKDVYENMQICFDFADVERRYDTINDSRRIADSVISSINSIDRLEIQVGQETKSGLEAIRESLQHSLSNEKTDVSFIQEQVERYNEYAIGIWNEYLTKTEDGKENDFKYLIHNLAKGEIKGDFRTKYMSTSLITNRTMGVFGGKSKYGLILKPKHIVSADYKDTYTNNYRGDDEQLFNIKPPIKLPQEIEEICIEQTIEANGEMLSYDEANIYSEIVVDEYEVVGMYFISNGEGELSPNYERAKRMAEERGIELKELDISQCRVDNGLEPMTENTQIEFCRNILYRCCDRDRKLQESYQRYSSLFTDKYAREFYEKYMQLKEQGKSSKEDILKIFAEMVKDDIHFNKISQNVEEMYLSDEEKENLRLQREYGISNMSDREGLQERLEKVISEGISYSADEQNPDKAKKFEEIKKVIPQFDEFKTFYLQLRVAGIEDELYKGIDYETVSYSELLERAKAIVKEQEEKKIQDEKPLDENIDGQSIDTNIDVETRIEKSEQNTTGVKINEYGGIIREGQTGTIPVVESAATTQTEASKKTQINSEEKIRPKEKSIRDEVGDEVKKEEQQMQEINNPTMDLWMNRFNNWYSSIDRVSQAVKAKFVKMRSDIIKAISEKIKERSNKQEISKNQDQNER